MGAIPQISFSLFVNSCIVFVGLVNGIYIDRGTFTNLRVCSKVKIIYNLLEHERPKEFMSIFREIDVLRMFMSHVIRPYFSCLSLCLPIV